MCENIELGGLNPALRPRIPLVLATTDIAISCIDKTEKKLLFVNSVCTEALKPEPTQKMITYKNIKNSVAG